MIRYVLFLVFSSLVVFSVSLSYRLGAFKDVTISQADRGPVALLYKDHIGAYHKINSVIIEVEKWAKTENLPCTRTFGEYLDDPRSNDEARLRSRGGCVLDNIESYTRSTPFPEGLSVKTLEKQNYVVAVFEGSPSIGPFKVYPKVEKYMTEMGIKVSGPVYEIYTIKGEKEAHTEYLFPYLPAQ